MTNRRNFLKGAAAGLAGLGIALPGLANIGKEIEGHLSTPLPKPGQKSVMGLRTEPLESVRIGLIGLGMRGMGAVERLLRDFMVAERLAIVRTQMPGDITRKTTGRNYVSATT